MKQIWHIFRKDVRHRWIELLVLLALLVLYAWKEIRSWSEPGFGARAFGLFGLLGSWPALVGLLIPVMWILLVIRAVQDESLVGDRQFWVTRPYDWKSLLAAKILFAIAFVSVPLFVMQLFLLVKAHFTPITPHLTALLGIQLIILLAVLLPSFTLSTVTRSIAQFALAVIVFILGMIGITYLNSTMPSSTFEGSSEALEGLLYLGIPVTVIVLQYAIRKTAASRMLLGVLGVLVVLIVVAWPYRSVADREYPASADKPLPFRTALGTVEHDANQRGPWKDDDSGKVAITIPLTISGLADDAIVNVRAQLVSFESAAGVRWNSGWTSDVQTIYPERKEMAINFAVKRKVWEQVKRTPLNLRVVVAYELFQDEDRRDMVTPDGEFSLPELGRCRSRGGYSANVECRSALIEKVNLLVTEDLAKSTCPLANKETIADPGTLARDWKSRDSVSADSLLSPIETTGIYTANWSSSAFRARGGICPGTPLVLSHPRSLYKAQGTMQFSDIRLEQYAAPSRRFSLVAR
jgi:hypothetical protein